ncbi:unnamed protein product [Phytophthora fragariaefolia]|uniref:Unnamed protein product n=1 Tax=Phytophthora fragariaefolia TaxID=1490495 RepID=A0A9W6UBZ9_9STRA|nr:unnamed protein product [Phytophthora fragariaefolia]
MSTTFRNTLGPPRTADVNLVRSTVAASALSTAIATLRICEVTSIVEPNGGAMSGERSPDGSHGAIFQVL